MNPCWMHPETKTDPKVRELTIKAVPTEAECEDDLCKVIFSNQCPFAQRFGGWVKKYT